MLDKLENEVGEDLQTEELRKKEANPGYFYFKKNEYFRQGCVVAVVSVSWKGVF